VKKTTLCSVYSLVLVCGNNDTDGKQVMLMLMHIHILQGTNRLPMFTY